jgi:hypothetical protein
MPKGDTFRNDFLKLIFNAVAIANIADNAASSPLTDLYLSLHTADPTTAGNQSSSEIAYTGYARKALVRTTSGWTVTGNSVSPVANVDFGKMTGGAGGTATHVVVGTALSGSGKILWIGTPASSIVVATNVVPRLEAGSTITET